MLDFDQILKPDVVLTNLTGTDREALLYSLTQELASRGMIESADEIFSLLLEREELMSTGVKRGFAFPHAFTSQLSETILCFAALNQPVEFGSLDGEPVEFIFLLLGPTDHSTLHLRTLARISRLMSQPGILGRLREALSHQNLSEALEQSQMGPTLARA